MKRIEIYTEGNISLPYKELTAKYIETLTKKILTLNKVDNVALCIILTDNEVIHKINREYRSKDKPTDVISFAYRDEPFPLCDGMEEELGDIYISLEKAEEQAKDFKVTFMDEFLRLLIHGILHLLGYDHERSIEDEKIMQKLEEDILQKISG